MFPVLAGSNPSGYNLTRSLRFRSSATAYLNRTPASASNLKTWTWSAWVKRGSLGVDYQYLFSAFYYSYPSPYNNYQHNIGFTDTDNFRVQFFAQDSGPTTYTYTLTTSQVFRDPSAWYHIQVVWDTTQATAANRVKVYVNGSQVTAFGTASYPTQNLDGYINSTYYHSQGAFLAPPNYPTAYYKFDGYMAEVNFIDGQALTPSSFGSTNTLTGVWQPARYSGTYGTNGFYLPFTDNSGATATTIGKDFSGNGNNWTPNNISVTAGVTYDSMTDVPTLTSSTAANYCVLNPVNKSPSSTVSNGNLRQTSSGGWYRAYSTIFFASTAAFYAEATMTSLNSGSNGVRVGIANANSVFTYVGSDANSWSYDNQGGKYTNGTLSSYGASYAQGDIVSILFNNGSLTFYKNGVSQGVAYSGLTGTFCFAGSPFDTDTVDWNFGQRPFSYSLPSGALALNTYNLPTSTIVKGNTVMDATLYTANASTQVITNAAGFKPDFVWTKSRTGAYSHQLWDSIRGVNTWLQSNSTTAEQTGTAQLTSFNSNGFTLGANENSNYTNGYAAVGWQWQAGQGTTSTNTSGSITSTVSVNASAGFSVVTYTGTGANATVGHGLGVAPSLIICKARSTTGSWQTYHSALTGTTGIFLDLTSAAFASSVYWNNTNPTSSVFSIGTSSFVNVASQTQVAYCWTPIAGYSAFGNYTGNSSADGPFVYTGFRPRWIMLKRVDTTGVWLVYDTSRVGYNQANNYLLPNQSDAEGSGDNYPDILSNGFKPRVANQSINTSGGTYIYMAFAETPFKNSLGR